MPQQNNGSQASIIDPSATVDAAAACQEHAAAAWQVANALPYRLVPDLVLSNIKKAESYVAARRDEIQEHFPKIPIADLDGLGRLALGLKYAAMVAEGAEPSEGEVSKVIAEAWELRGKLLPAVASMAAAGLVPQATYERIARGRGVRDAAQDCVELAQVFRDGGAALDGKHPVTGEQIERAALVGSWLLKHLKVKGARPEKAAKGDDVELRNRMATLLVERYTRLQAVAHYFEGDAWAEVVPPLMTRQATRREVEEPAATE